MGEMIELLKKSSDGYWSKADTFLLPLTGLPNTKPFNLQSYLFWRNYSIEKYQLIIIFEYDNYEIFMDYCRDKLFPVLDKSACITESYDIGNRSIFILDISEWALDIELFLVGKYSKLSREAKTKIEKFHMDKNQINVQIWGILYPTTVVSVLGNKTPIEYIIDNYGLLDERGEETPASVNLRKLAEIGSIYDKLAETLIVSVDELRNSDIESE